MPAILRIKFVEMGRKHMKIRNNIGILQNYHKNENGIYVNEYLWILPNGYQSARIEFPDDGQFAEDYLAMVEMIDPYAERLKLIRSQRTIERVKKKAGR